MGMRSSVFSPRVFSSTTWSMHFSSRIFISFTNCILVSFDIFVFVSFFPVLYLHVHAPLGILFHFTNGKLKSPLRIIVGSGFVVFLSKFSISFNILSNTIFFVFGGLYTTIFIVCNSGMFIATISHPLCLISHIVSASTFSCKYIATPPLSSFLSHLNILYPSIFAFSSIVFSSHVSVKFIAKIFSSFVYSSIIFSFLSEFSVISPRVFCSTIFHILLFRFVCEIPLFLCTSFFLGMFSFIIVIFLGLRSTFICVIFFTCSSFRMLSECSPCLTSSFSFDCL